MRIGSLFSGYGGLDMGVQAVMGGDVAWHVEYDPAPSRILTHHYPDTPNYGDVTAVDFATVEPVDVLTGGYPCQPFSTAGMRKGTDDDRHLWPHVLRAIRDLRPRWAVLENVRGHLSLGFAAVLADLAHIGWSAEWAIVRASDVGAPHQRARLFIVAYPDSLTRGSPRRPASVGGTVGTTHGRRDLNGHVDTRPSGKAQGVQGDCGQIVAYPEGVTQQGGGSETPGRLPRQPRRSDSPATYPAGHEQRNPPIGGVRAQPRHSDWGDYALAVTRWEHITGRPAPEPVMGRRLNPAFVEWMMGLPAGHVTDPAIGLSHRAQIKALGNGVVPQQAAHAVTGLLNRAVAA